MTGTRHLFSLFCTCLSDDFADVMALLADLIQKPTLPDTELATRKGEVITSIRQDEDSPGVRATEALMELLYPAPHPYGRRSKGTISIVESLTRDRLAALHAARFSPDAMCVVVVGDIDPAEAEAVVARSFGEWAATSPPAEPVSARRGFGDATANHDSDDEQGSGRHSRTALRPSPGRIPATTRAG